LNFVPRQLILGLEILLSQRHHLRLAKPNSNGMDESTDSQPAPSQAMDESDEAFVPDISSCFLFFPFFSIINKIAKEKWFEWVKTVKSGDRVAFNVQQSKNWEEALVNHVDIRETHSRGTTVIHKSTWIGATQNNSEINLCAFFFFNLEFQFSFWNLQIPTFFLVWNAPHFLDSSLKIPCVLPLSHINSRNLLHKPFSVAHIPWSTAQNASRAARESLQRSSSSASASSSAVPSPSPSPPSTPPSSTKRKKPDSPSLDTTPAAKRRKINGATPAAVSSTVSSTVSHPAVSSFSNASPSTPAPSFTLASPPLVTKYYQRRILGLRNLGNTCFMNSLLQCLLATDELNDYFFRHKWFNDLNPENPLGAHGTLAVNYFRLASRFVGRDSSTDYWGSVEPFALKTTIGRHAPQFSGYRQHDSQEFCSYLLDGLHEDLNRVVNKPYVEMKEFPGRPDREVAALFWENHLKRNQSVIVNTFQGQLKSKVECPRCDKVSITFDPFRCVFLKSKMMLFVFVLIVFFTEKDLCVWFF
jgi:hypothetical protein